MKTLNITLALVLASACGQKSSKTVHHYSTDSKIESVNEHKTSEKLAILQKLLNSRAANLSLAELLIKTFPEKDQAGIKSLLASLNHNEALSIIGVVVEDNKAIRKNYLFRGHPLEGNREFLDNALLTSVQYTNASMSVEDQLKLSVFAHVKNKALNDIITTYDERANILLKEIAQAVAFEIAMSVDSQEITKALKHSSKERVIKLIQAATPVVSKVDRYFKGSNLNDNEQYAVLVSAALAGAIYIEIKDDPTFVKIIQRGSVLAQNVTELQAKVKEMGVLVTALNKHFSETTQNIVDMQEGMEASGKEISSAFNQAWKKYQDKTISEDDPAKLEAKKVLNFLYKKVLLNTKTDETNVSVLSRPVRISENLNKSITAAGNIADNLSNIINTTNSMMKVLGMKPSKDLEKVLGAAHKVSMVVNLAKSAITGFASGGALGAFAALGSGPMMSMLGGGDQSSAMMMKQLKVMDKKLDEILRNQAEMMKAQLETMKMIKDLALMVDQFHHEEMVALAGLRSLQLVNIELQKSALNQNIRGCELIIDFQMSSIWKDYNLRNPNRTSFGISDISLVKSNFMKNITSLNDITRIINSTSETTFQDCQKGISDAFGSSEINENPIRSIFASDVNSDLNKFQQQTYEPLLKALSDFTDSDNFDAMALNLPSKNIKGLRLKISTINSASRSSLDKRLDMENLISSKSLERYLSQLLVLYPILEVDKEVWRKDYESIVNTYVLNANTENNHNIRSHYFLSNALNLIQSAIAQESILAGEPLLHLLDEKLLQEILDNDITCAREESLVCSLRNNPLLIKNLVIYTLAKQKANDPLFVVNYARALASKDLVSFARMYNSKNQFLFKTKARDEVFISLRTGEGSYNEIPMPTVEELEKEELVYSENMPRLLMMRDAVLESLEKVTPSMDDRTQDEKENFFKMLTLSANF